MSFVITLPAAISTHTLRGERDVATSLQCSIASSFQLTRSVGSATLAYRREELRQLISTHTLRGERDVRFTYKVSCTQSISTHTLRGERDEAAESRGRSE